MSFWKKITIGLAVFFIFGAFFWRVFVSPPKNFPSGGEIRIEKGETLEQISAKLSGKGFVKSRRSIAFLVKILKQGKKIKYGDYVFNEPLSVFGVIGRIIRGNFGIPLAKVVIPEGSDVADIAEIFKGFENFDKTEFLDKAKGYEGYLFPDTYLFLPAAETDEIIKAMRDNFSSKVGEIAPDAVIMASLIEKEASNGQDRKVISGILWKRLKIGMPLQVDAVFPYLTGRKNVTPDDLKIDSPYNTYLNKGLPPGPIANPGMGAIDAALHPEDSPYLYYLHDKNGTTRFARTYEEHLNNVEKYLR